MVRACGSYPQCRRFKSSPRYHFIHKDVLNMKADGVFFLTLNVNQIALIPVLDLVIAS